MCEDDESFLAGCVIGGVITLVAILIIGGIASDETSAKFINVDAKVESVVLHENYMTIGFDDGRSFNININTKSVSSSDDNKIDFDKSDHVLVRLRWSSGWLSHNTNDCWGIVSLIKY